MNPQKPNQYNLFRNFKYSFIGIFTGFKNEPNLSIQLLIGLLVSAVTMWQGKPLYYVIANLFAMCFVISIELINTSLEYLCDFVEPKMNNKIKFIKDVASGAVLTSALGWLMIICYVLLKS